MVKMENLEGYRMRRGPDRPHLQALKPLREVSQHQPAPARSGNYPNAEPGSDMSL